MSLKGGKLAVLSTALLAMLHMDLALGQEHGAQQGLRSTYDPHLHLFVDPDSILKSSGINVVVNNPVPEPQPAVNSTWKPHRMACAWGSVILEPDGKFRMWYLDFTGTHEMATRGVFGRGTDYGYYPQQPGDCRPENVSFICYAESEDGIHWEKPNLGLFEFNGSRENNIVCTGHEAAKRTNWGLSNMDGCTVIRDDREPDPQKRYKMFAYWEGHHRYDNCISDLGRPEEDIERFNTHPGHYICCSPDGIHWSYPERYGVPWTHADRNTVMYDFKRSRWRAIIRPRTKLPDGQTVRWISEFVSEDHRKWSDMNVLMIPDEAGDFAREPIPHDRVTEKLRIPEGVELFSQIQIHTFIPINYGNEDIGFMGVTGDGFQTYLACMGADEEWKRIHPDQPFIPTGRGGQFEGAGMMPTQNEPIVVGDELYIYYTTYAGTDPHPWGVRWIGLARMRRDAFVGITSDDESVRQSTFTTRPLEVTGTNLAVNFEKNGESAHLRVALLDEDQNPIEGYTLDDCCPVASDAVRAAIQWENGQDLKPLIGRRVSLRFDFREGTVYAVRFEN